MPFNLSVFIQLKIVMCSAWHAVHWFVGSFLPFFSFLAEQRYCCGSDSLWSLSRCFSCRFVWVWCSYLLIRQVKLYKMPFEGLKNMLSLLVSGYIWSSLSLSYPLFFFLFFFNQEVLRKEYSFLPRELMEVVTFGFWILWKLIVVLMCQGWFGTLLL